MKNRPTIEAKIKAAMQNWFAAAASEEMDTNNKEKIYEEFIDLISDIRNVYISTPKEKCKENYDMIINEMEKRSIEEITQLAHWISKHSIDTRNQCNHSFKGALQPFIELENQILKANIDSYSTSKLSDLISTARKNIELGKQDFLTLTEIEDCFLSGFELGLKELLALRNSSKNGLRLANQELVHQLNQGKLSLQDLGIQNDSDIGKNVVNYFGESCSLFSFLDLSQLTLEDLTFLKEFTGIQKLSLEGCLVKNMEIDCLLACQDICELNLKKSILKSSIPTFDFLHKLPKLKNLTIQGCMVGTGDIFKEMSRDDLLAFRASSENARKIANAILIERINAGKMTLSCLDHPLGISKNITSAKSFIDFFGKNIKELRVIHLENFDQLEDLDDLGYCNKLEDFLLNDCPRVTNISFLETCPELKLLYITKCSRINLKGLACLEKVKQVMLFYCDKITNETFSFLPKSITHFTILGCTFLDTSPDINCLVHCSELTYLELFVKEDDLQNLDSMQKFIKLKELTIYSGNPSLNFVKYLNSLEKLVLRLRKPINDLTPLLNHPTLKQVVVVDGEHFSKDHVQALRDKNIDVSIWK